MFVILVFVSWIIYVRQLYCIRWFDVLFNQVAQPNEYDYQFTVTYQCLVAFTQVATTQLKQDETDETVQFAAQPVVESHPPAPDVSNEQLASQPASATAQVCSRGSWVHDNIWCNCLVMKH